MHLALVQRHAADVEEAGEALALAEAIQVEYERGKAESGLAEVCPYVMAVALKADGWPEAFRWDDDVLEGGA